MSIQQDYGNMEGQGEESTWEEALHKLLRTKNVELHTEILKPDAMTAIDAAGTYWGNSISPGLGKLIKGVQKQKRINMVAYQRKRAIEVIRGVTAGSEQERRKKELKELMLATSR